MTGGRYVARIVEVPEHGLSGDAVMPWRPSEPGGMAFIVCHVNDGRPACEVRPRVD